MRLPRLGFGWWMLAFLLVYIALWYAGEKGWIEGRMIEDPNRGIFY